MVKKVQSEPASEREGELVERRQPGQQNWRHDGVAERQQRIVVGVVLVVIRSGVITAGEHGEPSEVRHVFEPFWLKAFLSREPLLTRALPLAFCFCVCSVVAIRVHGARCRRDGRSMDGCRL